jgi:hypothetical protein
MASTVRRAKLALRSEDLAEIFDVPDGARVVAVHAQIDPPTIYVIVEGGDLPEIPVDSEAPIVWAEWVLRPCPGREQHALRKYAWPAGGD